MLDRLRLALPLFVLFAGGGMALILLTRQPDSASTRPTPTAVNVQSDTRRALIDLAQAPATAVNACETSLNTGDFEAAVEVCTVALETLPADPALLVLRAQAHEGRGMLAQATSDYRRAASVAPPDSDLEAFARDRLNALSDE